MTTDAVASALAEAHRREWSLVVASVVRVVRDLDLAEECAQDAFADALEQWPRIGVPDKPGAWLITAARRRGVDAIRREATLRSKLPLLIEPRIEESDEDGFGAQTEEAGVRDDLLRLVLLCCHPALEQDAQSALTLRLICGVSTSDIARLFLVPDATIAARITRAKHRIAGSSIPFRLPVDELPARLERVLDVVYLLFTAGHAPPSGDAITRVDFVERALHLSVLLRSASPGNAEVVGLHALLIAIDARRSSRTGTEGELVRVGDQDRNRWDREAVQEARAEVMGALPDPDAGKYCLQAAIAILHAEPARAEDTDYAQMLGLYDRLLEIWPSPVVRMNRAVVLVRLHRATEALADLEEIAEAGRLTEYHLFHAVLGDATEALGCREDAVLHYTRALELATNQADVAYLRCRIQDLEAPIPSHRMTPHGDPHQGRSRRG